MKRVLRAEQFNINKKTVRKTKNQNLEELENKYEPIPNKWSQANGDVAGNRRPLKRRKEKRRGGSESTSILYISKELAGRVRDSRLDFAFENAGRSDWLGWGYEHPPLVVLYA